ncbi:MAG: hypothetical protein KatS3mg008_1304 [Acidimicrobiales bacterium]|nr:MAG: hypothetical protein KatS3mg008_1304 [Acidimicrobiales bacterium]
MRARRLADAAVEEVVRLVRSERASAEVLSQADRALAILRNYGWAELEALLGRDLPRTMNRAEHWSRFRKELAPRLRELHRTRGEPAVELYLAWLARRAKIEQRRQMPGQRPGGSRGDRRGPRPEPRKGAPGPRR